jgi:hypothetical protein
MSVTTEINPLQTVDDWAVLADGSIALIRGQDYHVDFIRADGSMSSSPKIAYDWQRLTDEDKVAIIDSAKAAFERARAAAPNGNTVIGGPGGGGPPGGGGMVVMNFSMRGGEGGGGIRTGESRRWTADDVRQRKRAARLSPRLRSGRFPRGTPTASCGCERAQRAPARSLARSTT